MIRITTDRKIKEEQERILREDDYKRYIDRRLENLENRIWELQCRIDKQEETNEACTTRPTY